MRYASAVLAVLAGLSVGLQPLTAAAQDTDSLRSAVDAQRAQSPDAGASDTEAPEPVLRSDEELDRLVAPVALYPDALLSQVLVAATYPLQVVEADRFLKDAASASDADVAAELQEKTWDPSVTVLASGFPTVIERLSENLEDTEALGQAMLDQDEDVLAAVQRMRAQAKDMGYLESNAAQRIEEDPSGSIAIVPSDPKTVYVPTYDPQTVYTTRSTAAPYVAPVSTGTTGSGLQPNPLLTGALAFGAALLVQELFGNNDDDDNHDGWDDYWNRDPIDWRDRQFYPRPRSVQGYHPWSWERDRYWDPYGRRWDRSEPIAVRAYDAERRDTLGWVLVPDRDRPEPWVRGFGRPPEPDAVRARRAAERQAAERRQARLEAERRQDRADRAARAAEEERAARRAAQRREARQKAEAEHRAHLAPVPSRPAQPARADARKPAPHAPAAKPAPAKPAARARREPAAKPARDHAAPPAKTAAPERQVKPAAVAKPKPKPEPKPAAAAKPAPTRHNAAKPAPQHQQKAQAPARKPAPKPQAKPQPKPAATARPAPTRQNAAKPAAQQHQQRAQAPARKPAQEPARKKKAECKPDDPKCRQK